MSVNIANPQSTAKAGQTTITTPTRFVEANGIRFAYLKDIKQPTLVLSGNHDVIVYTVNSLHLAQNLPNAKLVLYPDANHGSWHQYHEAFVAEANSFLNA